MLPRIHTLNFETSEGAAPLGGGEESAAEEAWSGVSQEQWQQAEETLGMIREAMEASQQQPEPQHENGQQQASLEIPDQYADPQGFANWQREQIRQETAELREYVNHLQNRDGHDSALDGISDLEAREGEFLQPELTRERAYELADRHYPEMVARYGKDGNKASDAALAAGYKEAKEYELAIGKAYHEREINQLATLSGAPRDLAAAGAPGATQTTISQGGDERSVVDRWFRD